MKKMPSWLFAVIVGIDICGIATFIFFANESRLFHSTPGFNWEVLYFTGVALLVGFSVGLVIDSRIEAYIKEHESKR